jgi:hypothetical protein
MLTNAPFFAKFFLRKYFKNKNIGSTQVRSDRLKKVDPKFVQRNAAFLLDNLLSLVSKTLAGPNPRTSIYNASVVNFYNATNSLARF